MSKQAVILLTSPQGGSGKSTLAVNMAIHYAKLNIKVLLMDLAGYGSLPSMLKIPIRGKGMSSLITAMEQSENKFETDQFNTYFRDAIIPHQDFDSLHLMLSSSPLKMEKLSLQNTTLLLETAKNENYQIIIIDSSPELSERNIACIERADLILIPTLQDVTSGWKLILFKEILNNLNIPRERVSLIINRCNKYSGFHNQEFQQEVGYPIIYELDDLSKVIQRFANLGVPAVNSGKRKAAVPFQKLSAQVLKKVGVS
jgi:cellulose biosynthesis protein BcsQ